ncbi:MAG: HAD-IB family phosphatase [Anaerolineae bacterium]
MINPWRAFDLVFFDCDSTLSQIEGIDELARLKGLFNEVQRLTNAAMDGEVHLQSIYDRRLQLLRPSRGEMRRLERLYRQHIVPDAAEVLAALRFLDKEVFIVSGGLFEAVAPFGEWLGVPADHVRAVEVSYDVLSGEWWNYEQDRWGRRLDVQYLDHNGGPLVETQGKADVVRDLRGERVGRSVLVGDGVSDLAARPEVDRVIGFGGAVRRERVAAEADIFIDCNSLAPVLPLVTSPEERACLLASTHEALLKRGLALLATDRVKFREEAHRRRALAGAEGSP